VHNTISLSSGYFVGNSPAGSRFFMSHKIGFGSCSGFFSGQTLWRRFFLHHFLLRDAIASAAVDLVALRLLLNSMFAWILVVARPSH
jgi:hypothetical protein